VDNKTTLIAIIVILSVILVLSGLVADTRSIAEKFDEKLWK